MLNVLNRNQIVCKYILQNNNGKLIIKPLPYQAQFSNINSIVVEDIDIDEISSYNRGNLYNAEVETQEMMLVLDLAEGMVMAVLHKNHEKVVLLHRRCAKHRIN